MELFLASLCVLAASALCAALSGEKPWANALGAGGACLGCALGLFSLLADFRSTHEMLQLPWGLPFGAFAIDLDPLTRIFLLPCFTLGAVCALSGAAHLSHSPPHEHNLGAHWAFYNLLLLGLALVPAARDAVLFVLAWEVMSLAPFFLIDFYDNDAHVREASWIYLVAAHLGAVCLIGMFGLLWAQTGSTAFSAFTAAGFEPAAASALFMLALLGFGAKAGFVPFHVWLPEAHPAAPSHISALLSGAMVNAGIYGLMRSLNFFGQSAGWWGPLLLGAGVMTGLIGILKALGQSELKRLLAYSSVENMGIALIGIGTGVIGAHSGNAPIAVLGYTAALLHVLNHAAVKGLLFLCAGEVLHGAHTVQLEFLGGLQKRMPRVGAAFALGACCLACLPPFNCFAGEFLLILALFKGASLHGIASQASFFGALACLIFMGGLAAATFAKAYGIVFLGEARSGAARNASAPGKTNSLCLALLALCCLALALSAPGLPALLAPAALAPLPAPAAAEGAGSIAEAAGLLEYCVLIGGILTALFGVLLLLRGALLARAGTRASRTWDCGFQLANPRIQYSAVSFTEPLAKLFAAAMGLSRRHVQWGTFFPSRANFDIRLSDRLLNDVFTPLFNGIRRICDNMKIVQHGRIHIYILYILVTAAGLLVWGLCL